MIMSLPHEDSTSNTPPESEQCPQRILRKYWRRTRIIPVRDGKERVTMTAVQ